MSAWRVLLVAKAKKPVASSKLHFGERPAHHRVERRAGPLPTGRRAGEPPPRARPPPSGRVRPAVSGRGAAGGGPVPRAAGPRADPWAPARFGWWPPAAAGRARSPPAA